MSLKPLAQSRKPPWLHLAVVAVLLAVVAYVDHDLGAFLPTSHLYYLPILYAAVYLGYSGGAGAGAGAILLFHLTHFVLSGSREPLDESDVMRLGLFLAVGLVTARLVDHRRQLASLATELEERNAELARLNGELSELSRARADFVAMAAHELRTPLTAILGSADIVIDRPSLSAERRDQFLSYVRDGALRLQRTVDSLLDAALIESGRFSLRYGSVDLGGLLLECQRSFGPAKASQLLLPRPLPEAVLEADRDRLLQVLVNLVGNAFKYSPPESQVKIEVEVSPPTLRIAVVDQGYGIAREDLAHIFERYYRASNGRVSAVRGAGIGLSVSHDIVQAHGGELLVDSKEGQGSIFTVVLPLVAAFSVDDALATGSAA